MENIENKNIIEWNRTLPLGVTSKLQYYNTLSTLIDECLEQCSEDAIITIPYNLLPVFVFMSAYKSKDAAVINGTYWAGDYTFRLSSGTDLLVQVYVSPFDTQADISIFSEKNCFNILVK